MAEELANIAEETGAEVLRGALRYPSENGGWQLGDMDLGEHLEKYRDHEVIVTIASVGKAAVVLGVIGPSGTWVIIKHYPETDWLAWVLLGITGGIIAARALLWPVALLWA